MKKIVCIVLVLVVATLGCFALTACNKDVELVSVVATDLLQEDFGIAVKKGNTELMNEVNEVIDTWINNGDMDKYSDYYEAVAAEKDDNKTAVPEGLKVTWDFGTATETITVYTESGFAPYEFIYNNEVIGLDIAIMSQVALNMGKKIDVQDVAFDIIPSNVSESKGDAVGAAGLTINAERLEVVDFSNTYVSSTLVIVSAKENSFGSVEALAGKKVGVQQGTSGDLIISDATTEGGFTYKVEADGVEENKVVKAAGATVTRYQQYSLVLADLQNGRIDAILMDKIPATLLLASIG